MKGTTTHRQNVSFIAAFSIATVFASIAAVRIGFPDQFLMLLLAPILLAALLSRRYVYLVMIAVLFVCAMIVTENFQWPITDSTITVAATVLTTVVACELIRLSVRRQQRLWRRIAESEQRLRAVIDNASDAVFTIDADGRVIDVNESVAGFLGFSRNELIGSAFANLFTVDASTPLDLNDNARWSGNLKAKDGKPAPVEISVGHAKHGRGTVHIAIVRDQAERDRAEAQLRHEEAVRESILESTPDHVIMVGLDYRIRFINRTVPDLTVEGVLGKNILDLVPPERRESIQRVYDRVRDTQQPGVFETEYVSTHDGSVAYFESRIAPIIEANEVAGFIVSASDATERKRAEAERLALERRALQSQKLESLGLLAGGVAHDFNNLLVAIMGRADLARGDLNDPAKTDAHLSQIIEASEHAAGLCRQLLAYSGKGKFAIAPIAIADLVNEARKLLEISVPENVQIELDVHAAPAVVEADSTQLKQVLMNLISNASDAMQPGGGTVVVRTGVQHLAGDSTLALINGERIGNGAYGYFEVADEGAGMTSETMERLFDPFFTTKPDGTGLGMAAVLGIVRGHGGAMSVASNEAAGTTIRALFPASTKPAPHPPSTPDTEFQTCNGGGLVLVVDDEPTVRNVAQRILERAQFEVIAVDSGADAIDAVKARGAEIAAIVLDMKMPDMNGEQVMERVRALQPAIPILLSSGYSETEVTQRSQGKGVSAVLPKPYRAKELVNAINNIVLAAHTE